MQNGIFRQKMKRGRPTFNPTKTDRYTVRIATAGGLSGAETAALVGVSRETLRTHFPDELRDGRTRAYVDNLMRLDRAAQRGSVSAAKFLVGVFSAGAPALGGKKARAEAAARSVVEGDSVWAKLLRHDDDEEVMQ
jgi:hypothetical protein